MYIYCFFLSRILSEFCFFWVIPKAPPFDVVLTAFSSCLEKCPRSASAALRTWRCRLRCFSSAFLGIFLILCPLVKLFPAAQLPHRSTSWVEFEKRNAPNSLKLGILGVIQLETLKKKISVGPVAINNNTQQQSQDYACCLFWWVWGRPKVYLYTPFW